MSNLRLINETNVTSSTSTVNVTDVFSADYDIYKITLDNITCSGSSDNFSARLINSSGSQITNNYDYAGHILWSYTGSGENKNTGQNRWHRLVISGTVLKLGGLVMYVFNPFSSSSYSFQLSQANSYDGSGMQGYKSIGVNKNTTSCTGISFFDNGGLTIDNIDIKVFGLRVDS